MASRAVRIALKDKAHEVVLAWDRFDGDDCFEDFRIEVTLRSSAVHVYEFGACAVRAVRKMKLFLDDCTQPSVGGGFRHPDIRTYDWSRSGPDMKLLIRFEGSGLDAEYSLESPTKSIEELPYSYE